MSPRVSILIPIFNASEFLGQCLDSIFAQDLSGMEIVLYNDGSTDSSEEICKSYAENNPQTIRYYEGDGNKGISAARNKLVELSTGQYLWFVDADDYLLPNSLNKLREIIDRETPDLVLFDYLRNNSKKKKSFAGKGRILSNDNQRLIAGVFECRKLYCWQKVFKREILEAQSFPDGQIFEDIAAITPALLQVRSYYYIPEALINYRVTDNSIMGEFSRSKKYFDVKRHDDLLSALSSLSPLVERPNEYDKDVIFWTSNYVAREYIKSMARYGLESKGNPRTRPEYRRLFEEKSPLSFRDLAKEYFLRGKFNLLFKLIRAHRH